MFWLVHFVGGPLHGSIEPGGGHWPLLTKRVGQRVELYRLACWVAAQGSIEPHTPLLYVWEGIDRAQASEILEAYISLHSGVGGVLAGQKLTRSALPARSSDEADAERTADV